MVFFPVDMHEIFSSGNLPRKKHIDFFSSGNLPRKSTSLAKKKDFDICVSFFFWGGGGTENKST